MSRLKKLKFSGRFIIKDTLLILYFRAGSDRNGKRRAFL